jgi:hypothetical protein
MIGVVIAWHLVCKRGVWTTFYLTMNAKLWNKYLLTWPNAHNIPKIWVAISFHHLHDIWICVCVCVKFAFVGGILKWWRHHLRMLNMAKWKQPITCIHTYIIGCHGHVYSNLKYFHSNIRLYALTEFPN